MSAWTNEKPTFALWMNSNVDHFEECFCAEVEPLTCSHKIAIVDAKVMKFDLIIIEERSA